MGCSRPQRRALRLWLLALLAVGVLTTAERTGRWLLAHFFLPTGAGQWIWAAGVSVPSRAVAFYAVKDFDLEPGPHQARLLVLADEEYVLWLNGQRVGSNRYASGAPLDEYEVSRLLLGGRNRLVAKLRSRLGAGGFLASLSLDPSRPPVVVSDDSWRVFHQHQNGLIEAWLPAADGAAPQVWQSPPTGRWGAPGPAGLLRPPFAQLLASESALEVKEVRVLPGPQGVTASAASTEPRRPGSRHDPAVVLDWGQEVTGYLEIDATARVSGAYPVYVMSQPPSHDLPDPAIHLIPMPGTSTWHDSQPRSFRYVVVRGVEELQTARVLPLRESWRPKLLAGPRQERGILGIPPPR